jgi:hypothetical protein
VKKSKNHCTLLCMYYLRTAGIYTCTQLVMVGLFACDGTKKVANHPIRQL